MSRALTVARASTASLGKFDESLPKEKPEKQRGKKRKVRLMTVVEISDDFVCEDLNTVVSV